jgi:hypothetical protein
MKPPDGLTAEALRSSIAYGQLEVERFVALIERDTVPDVTAWAKLSLEALTRRIQSQKEELQRLEGNYPDDLA